MIKMLRLLNAGASTVFATPAIVGEDMLLATIAYIVIMASVFEFAKLVGAIVVEEQKREGDEIWAWACEEHERVTGTATSEWRVESDIMRA